MIEETNYIDNISTFFRDQIWSAYGVLATIIAILVSIWIYYKQRSKTVIGYNVVSSSPIIRYHKGLEELKITFKNKEASTAHVSVIDIVNIGNTPVKKDQYDVPIRLTFSKNSEIVNCTVLDVHPEEINVISSCESNVCQINELLLNRNDRFRISIVTINGDAELNVTARIVGGRLIQIYQNTRTGSAIRGAIIAFLGVSTGVLSGKISEIIIGRDKFDLIILNVTVFSCLAISVGLLFQVMRARRKR